MTSRYEDRIEVINNDPRYENYFRERRVNYIRQYKSASLTHIDENADVDFQEVPILWGFGDAFYKLAQKYYGEAELWWVIAWYNLTPTEHHVVNGQEIYVPLPLSRVLSILRSV